MRFVLRKRSRHPWWHAVLVAVAIAVDTVAVLGRARVDVAVHIVAVAASKRTSRRDRIGAREHDRAPASDPVTVVVCVEQTEFARIRSSHIIRRVCRVCLHHVDDVGRIVRGTRVGRLHVVRASVELDAIGLCGRW